MAVKNLEALRSDFCYISALLHVVFFSGQCGFNMGLLVMLDYDHQPVDYVIFTIWLVSEGFLITLISTLLLYGMYKQIHECLMCWLVVVLICLLLSLACTVVEFFDLPDAAFTYFAPLNSSFYYRRIDIIGIIWRIYLIVTIGAICWLYRDMKKSSASETN